MSVRRARRLLAALLVGLPLTACGLVPSGTTYAAGAARFTAPPGWDVRTNAREASAPGRVALLANQPIDPDCHLPEPCADPVVGLGPGDVLVLWVFRNCLPDCQLPDEGRLLVGGREAIRAEAEVPCGYGTSAETVVVAVTPQRHDLISACYGGDDPAARAAFDGLLASIAWTVP